MRHQLPRLVLLLAALCSVSLAQTFPATPVCALAGLACGASSGNITCCNPGNYECRPIAGRVGTFCLPIDDVCFATGAQCAGTNTNGEAVDESKPCCDSELAECKEWMGDPMASPQPGSYCQKKCYEKNERCIGAPGFPYVVFKPCCNPDHVCEEVPGGLWGKFCVEPSDVEATASAEPSDEPDPSEEPVLPE